MCIAIRPKNIRSMYTVMPPTGAKQYGSLKICFAHSAREFVTSHFQTPGATIVPNKFYQLRNTNQFLIFLLRLEIKIEFNYTARKHDAY